MKLEKRNKRSKALIWVGVVSIAFLFLFVKVLLPILNSTQNTSNAIDLQLEKPPKPDRDKAVVDTLSVGEGGKMIFNSETIEVSDLEEKLKDQKEKFQENYFVIYYPEKNAKTESVVLILDLFRKNRISSRMRETKY